MSRCSASGRALAALNQPLPVASRADCERRRGRAACDPPACNWSAEPGRGVDRRADDRTFRTVKTAWAARIRIGAGIWRRWGDAVWRLIPVASTFLLLVRKFADGGVAVRSISGGRIGRWLGRNATCGWSSGAAGIDSFLTTDLTAEYVRINADYST